MRTAAYTVHVARRPIPALGHPLIDRQHRRLERLSLALHAAAVHGRPALALLSSLLRDTIRHFASEERLMRVHGYREALGHISLHQGVVAEMERLQALLRQGVPLHRKHTAMIGDWLEHHVSEADRNLVAFITSRVSGAAAGR